MSVFVPSTLVSVMRGTGADAFGDDIDLPLVIASDQPAAITEGTQRRYRPTESRGDTVEQYTIRMRPDADVEEGDRILAQNNGTIYLVQDVARSHSIIGFADVRVNVIRVGYRSQEVNN